MRRFSTTKRQKTRTPNFKRRHILFCTSNHSQCPLFFQNKSRWGCFAFCFPCPKFVGCLSGFVKVLKCVCERENVCECEREYYACVCVCVRERENIHVCVCVCVRERAFQNASPVDIWMLWGCQRLAKIWGPLFTSTQQQHIAYHTYHVHDIVHDIGHDIVHDIVHKNTKGDLSHEHKRHTLSCTTRTTHTTTHTTQWKKEEKKNILRTSTIRPMLAKWGLVSPTVKSFSCWRVKLPPSFIIPDDALFVCVGFF